jgi:hypothetical protein
LLGTNTDFGLLGGSIDCVRKSFEKFAGCTAFDCSDTNTIDLFGGPCPIPSWASAMLTVEVINRQATSAYLILKSPRSRKYVLTRKFAALAT